MSPSNVDHTANDRSGERFGALLSASLDRMIAIQATAYPDSWSDADKRELAELHLFGDRFHEITEAEMPIRNQIPMGGTL